MLRPNKIEKRFINMNQLAYARRLLGPRESKSGIALRRHGGSLQTAVDEGRVFDRQEAVRDHRGRDHILGSVHVLTCRVRLASEGEAVNFDRFHGCGESIGWQFLV